MASKALKITVLALMVDLIGFTMILPLFPSILEDYKRSDTSGIYAAATDATVALGKLIGSPKAQSETVLIGGILGSLFSFLQFLFAPIIGAYSDVKGRRDALLFCLVSIIESFNTINKNEVLMNNLCYSWE